jgi:hypothetical protein
VALLPDHCGGSVTQDQQRNSYVKAVCPATLEHDRRSNGVRGDQKCEQSSVA